MASAALSKRARLWFAAMLGALRAAGCGYHFAASGSGLPQNAKTIYVARFSNTSRFTGVSEADSYQQFMVVRAQLQDRHTNKVLWANVLSSIDPFPVVSPTVITTSPEFLQQNLRSQDIANLPNIQVAQTQQAFSGSQMMTRMAQDIYSAIPEGF